MNIDNLKQKFNQLTLESEDHWDYKGNAKSERDYVHGFCTYPAMMVPKMQREILDVCLADNKKKHIRLLDPFAGSGTILVEGMLRGLDVVGVDINPLAILLCKVKTTIIIPNDLSKSILNLKNTIQILKNTNLTNFYFNGIEKWFTNRAITDLTVIRNAILLEQHVEIRRFFWAAFCEVVRIVSNSRDCTYKLHIKELKDIDSYSKDAVDIFIKVLNSNFEKYISFFEKLKLLGYVKKETFQYKGKVEIVLQDTIEYLSKTQKNLIWL